MTDHERNLKALELAERKQELLIAYKVATELKAKMLHDTYANLDTVLADELKIISDQLKFLRDENNF